MAAKRWITWAAIAVMIVMVASSLAVVGSTPASAGASSPAAVAAAPAATTASSVSSSTVITSSTTTAASTAVNSAALQVSTSRAELVKSAQQAFINAGIPLTDFLPPNLNAAPGPVSETGGHIVPLYSYAAAPIGISTFGLENNSGTTKAYILNTTSLLGTFSTSDPRGLQLISPYYGSLQSYGDQLNTVLNDTTLNGVAAYDFWLQNVIQYSDSSGTLSFENNIWNFSSPSGIFPSASILHGLGRVEESEVYEESGPSIAIAYPFTLDLYLNTTVGSYQGSPLVNEVYFNYSIYNSAGQHVCPATEPTGEVCGMYDNVYFNSKVSVAPGSAEIQANGEQYTPLGLPSDMEMDVGIGQSDGANANVVYSNATVGLYVLNATTHKYQAPQSTYDFGSETGETGIGSLTTFSPTTATNLGVVGGGGPTAYLRTGPSWLTGLWNVTGGTDGAPTIGAGAPGAFELNYAAVAPGNAFIAIAQGAGVTNQSFFQVAPTSGWFSGSGRLGKNIWLPAGATYTVQVMLSGYTQVTSNVVLTSNQALTTTLSHQATPTVYTPLWAYSNQDLANLSTSGAGTSVSPYVLVGTQTGSLSPVFASLNDYLFIVYSGIWINSTTAYFTFNPPPSLLITEPTWWYFQTDGLAASYGGTPTYNQLPMYFNHASNFVVEHAASIGLWSSGIEVGHNYAVYCNTCSNALFASNVFNVSSEGLEFLGAGANQLNYVWGNTFTPFTFPGAGSLEPGSQYGGVSAPSTGLVVTESGDHIYNNAFYTNRTATSAAADHNFWNVTGASQPASYSVTVNGVALTGANILGQNFQGGNFWRDYGATPNPYGVLPYVSRQTSPTGSAGIGFGGDFNPLSVVAPKGAGGPGLYAFTVTESGLANAAAWTIRVNGVTVYVPLSAPSSYTTNPSNTTTVSASLVTNTLWLPNGTYTWKLASFPTNRAPSITTGTVTINGQPASVGISFNQVTYVVSFKESGLPVSTVWSVQFNGVLGTATVTATQLNVTFSIANGTGYTYKIGAVAGYTVSATPSTVTVAGAPVVVTVTFTPNVVHYTVYFTESGLPAGTPWSVTVSGGGTASGTTATLSFTEANGTYNSFVFTPSSGYTATPSVSSVTISGLSVSIAVTFSPIVYTVTFTESGLPANTLWAVALNGVIASSSSTTITFSVINGVYTYQAGYEAGYTSATTSGPSSPLTVSGASVGVTITFTAIPSTAHPIGLPVGLGAALRPAEMRA